MTSAGFCTTCGAPRLAGARFCRVCGAALRAWAGGAAAPVPIAPVTVLPVNPPAPIRGLPLGTLLPLRAWFLGSDWRRGWIALFLVAALTPFVLVRAVGTDDDLHDASIGFSVYFALLWVVAIHNIVRPEPLPLALLAKVCGFTLVAGVAIALALERFLDADTDAVLTSVLTVGVPEELAKALPVFLFLYLGRTEWSVRTYLFVGALSGITFGAAEAVAYSELYTDVLALTGGAPGVVVQALWRLIAGGLFHGCMTGIVAFAIGLARRHPAMRVRLVTSGLLLAAVLHGVYNRWSGEWGGTLLACVIVFTFVGYVRSAEQIDEALRHNDAVTAPSQPVQPPPH
jgi:RsiW-degrading membrane proteinase PrsW (M82 family)